MVYFFKQMHVEGALLTKFASIAILSTFTEKELLEDGKRVHTIIFALGLEKDIHVATSILNMYGKCQNISKAIETFHRIPCHDIVSWNAMLAAYVKTGNANDAFKLFHDLIDMGISPTRVTFLSMLEACIISSSLESIGFILKHIYAQNLQADIFVSNALIKTYSKCGSIENAERVFNEMQQHDTISWNTMIATYTQHGQQKNALDLFRQVQKEKIVMDSVTYINLLSLCANSMMLSAGEQIHNHIVCVGMEWNVVVGTALLNMYGKNRKLDEATSIFSNISKDDVVTWNAIISAYGEQGYCDIALSLFGQMYTHGVEPDKVTFIIMIDTCTYQENFEGACKLHKLIQGTELENDVIVGTSLMKMYGTFHCLIETETLFGKMLERDIIMYNTMIALHVENEQSDKALVLHDQMLQEGVLPNKAAVSSLLTACASEHELGVGKRLHTSFVSINSKLDIIVGSALTRMYGQCGCLQEAYIVFDEIHERDLIAWTTMISLHAHQEHHDKALQSYMQLQQEGVVPDVVTIVVMIASCASKELLLTCRRIHASIMVTDFISDLILGNALVNAYNKCGSMKDAYISFEQMSRRDKISFLIILCACATDASIREGQTVHSILVAWGMDSDSELSHALITMYGKCGSLKDARKVFDLVSEENVITWNATIAAYAQNGDGHGALLLFQQMQDGTVPDNLSFVSILTACSHAGLVEEGWNTFIAVCHSLSVSLISDHYNCMVDILARAGQLHEAEGLIQMIPMLPTAVTWTTLLGACKAEMDIKRGENVAVQAMSLVPNDAAILISLSNIYSATEKLTFTNGNVSPLSM
ncbi:hypothetical protein KP509_16G044900 [Ceratopteris richardii]|nr:hypothetical protein KP509_16G044900 [Ceratopteris richardii]